MQTLKIGINSTLSHATIFLTQRCGKALIIDIMFLLETHMYVALQTIRYSN